MKKPLHILLVEDHDDVAEMMTVMLQMLGHESERAASVREAVERCAAGGVDALVVDYGLPDGTGDEVIRRCPGIPAILLTAYNQSFLDTRLVGLRALFRQKPLDMELLEKSLADAVGQTES